MTWEATHFLVRQRMTVEITAFERPARFRDEIVSGVFARFVHDHEFEERGDGTLMRDVLAFASPLGPLGRIADALAVTRHLRRLVTERNALLKEVAEDPARRARFLGGDDGTP